MSVLDGPLVYVDIETNGLSPTSGKIIEIAALRVENNQLTASFDQLLDPGSEIPPFISQLTGITAQDIARAPMFEQVADELYAVLEGAVFVAHNVRFDYGFIKQEFRHINRRFNPKLLCTIKLSRNLYPKHRGHKLQNLIERCGITVENRHRAFDDAKALWQFVQHAQKTIEKDILNEAIARQIKTPALPRQLPAEIFQSLPETPGVYIFQDASGNPLYIGKSINIKKRVASHFARDHETASEFKISQSVADLEVQTTNGELEALLLESQLIKQLQPLYNRQLRRNQKLTLARQKINADGYISVSLEDTDAIEPDELKDILAVYSTKGKARVFLTDTAKAFGLCPKLLGLEKSSASCFLYQLKKCRGACVGKLSPEEYNQNLLNVFERQRLKDWPYSSPVLIEEKTAENEIKKTLVVDQWCLVAEISQEPYCEPIVKHHHKVFDFDSYKILQAYFRDKRHLLKIQPVTHDQLAAGSGLSLVKAL